MIVLRILLFIVSVTFIHNEEVIEDKRVRSLVKERKQYQKVRCSRRFTPGSCLDPVRPVWTFVAPLQTCTERLGCPSGVFTNRFNSYEECRTMCSDLVYLFMYLQSLDNDTFRVPDEGLESSTRQANVDVMYSEIMQQHEVQDSVEDDDFKDDGSDDEDYRRNFHEALSNLPELNPDYPVERPYEASDDRPPPSRRELVVDSDLIVPDIDRF